MNRRAHVIAVVVWGLCWGLTAAQTAPQGGRGFGGRAGREPTPEERDAFYNQITQRFLEQVTEIYQLDDQQRDWVRQRLQQVRAQHEAYAAPLRAEQQAVMREMRELRQRQAAGQAVDTQRYEQLRQRMRQMWEGSPLFNRGQIVADIEAGLSPEQVSKAGERRQELLGDWWRRSGQQPGDEWARFVEGFSRRYQLDASQRATAESLLRSSIAQRETYRKAHQGEVEAAEKILDAKERGEKLKALREPVDRMFGELRAGLEKIPTQAQKEAVAASAPAGLGTRPVGASTRPAGVGTRPARRGRR